MKLNKKRIVKKLKKLNFATVFFFIMSLISTTFAWFAFTNVVNNNMEINVKTWQVDINDNEGSVSNKLDIKMDSFFPGSEIKTKTINIKNAGDLPSTLTYKIDYLRIFDREFDLTNQEELFDKLSEDYPFTINFSLDNNYLDNDSDTNFTYSIIWPLDSGNDKLDTEWGNEAYKFYQNEQEKQKNDSSYTIRKGIELIVELVVEQYVGDANKIPDKNYLKGSEYYFNSNTLESCSQGEENCLRYYVIDNNNLVEETEVNFMVDATENHNMVSYTEISTDSITVTDILSLIKKDVLDTNIVRPNLSNRILGNYTNADYNNNILNLINGNNTIEFSKSNFNYLKSNECYWIYDELYTNLAIKNKDDNTIMIYKEEVNQCKYINKITKQKTLS